MWPIAVDFQESLRSFVLSQQWFGLVVVCAVFKKCDGIAISAKEGACSSISWTSVCFSKLQYEIMLCLIDPCSSSMDIPEKRIRHKHNHRMMLYFKRLPSTLLPSFSTAVGSGGSRCPY